MRTIGFSTGAIARSDVERAVNVSNRLHADAVEYSALRFGELQTMVTHLLKVGIGKFRYVSFHAPSRFAPSQEPQVVALLKQLTEKFKAVSIVVHPDTITNFTLWHSFGSRLCVENMDHRKPIGRTVEELEHVFHKLPKARLCFDIGHAHEIDRSMSLGFAIVRHYRNRIAHLHASEVSDECQHRAFSASSRAAFQKLNALIPAAVPIILETDVPEERAGGQLDEAKHIFAVKAPKRIRRQK